MHRATLFVFAAVVAMALAEGQYYIPRAYYVIDAEGHASAPVPLRRLRRSLNPLNSGSPYPYNNGGHSANANANAHAESQGWGGNANANANANARANSGGWQYPGGWNYGSANPNTVRH